MPRQAPGLVLLIFSNVQGALRRCVCVAKSQTSVEAGLPEDVLDVWNGQMSDLAGIVIESEPHEWRVV